MKNLALNNCLTFLFLLFSTLSLAQEAFYYNEETEEDYSIYRDTDREKIDKYLNLYDFKSIVFNPDTTSIYSFRVETNKGGWLLCDNSDVVLYGGSKLSLDFPTKELEKCGMTTVTRKKRKYFFSFENDDLQDDIWFDEMYTYSIMDSVREMFSDYPESKTERITHYYMALKRKKKWALVYIPINDYRTIEYSRAYQLTPFGYDEKGDLPIEEVGQLIKEIDDYKYGNREDYIQEVFESIHFLTSKEKNYTKIEFNSNKDSNYPFRLKNRDLNWKLVDHDGSLIHWNDVSIGFPLDSLGQANISIAEDVKGRKHFVLLDQEKGEFTLNRNYWFSELIPHMKKDSIMMEQHERLTGEVLDFGEYNDYLMIRKNDKWAIGAFSTSESPELPFLLSGFHFDNPKDLPDSLISNYYNFEEELYHRNLDDELMKTVSSYIQANPHFDIVFPIGKYKVTEDHSKPILQVRHAETNRSSLIIPGGFREGTELPVAASSIIRHDNDFYSNMVVFEVWCDNKVGFYFYDETDINQILPCEFVDFQYVHFKEEIFDNAGNFNGTGAETYGCALKTGDLWELYYLDSPKKIIEGSANTVEELETLWVEKKQ